MAVIVCLLRGVNVGGKNRIRMDALKALCEEAGCARVETYVQSGNAVFSTRQQDLTKMARRIEDAIERHSGFRPAIVLRTREQLAEIAARNPFAEEAAAHPAKLAVMFLASDPCPDAHLKLASLTIGPEKIHAEARELYVYFPNGMGRTKFPFAALDRALKVPVTARNWNTVTRLLEMAKAYS